MKQAIQSNFWTVLFALVFVGMMQPLLPMLERWWEKNTPVVDMRGEVVTKTGNSVLIHITGEKIRQCVFVRLTAMTVGKSGALVDAYLERSDGKPQDGSTKPTGMYDLGLWRVWPTDGSLKAVVFAQHTCGGEVVVSKIAEVTL